MRERALAHNHPQGTLLHEAHLRESPPCTATTISGRKHEFSNRALHRAATSERRWTQERLRSPAYTYVSVGIFVTLVILTSIVVAVAHAPPTVL